MRHRPAAHILLIDDDPMHVELTQCAFQELGLPHTVHVALGGRLGVDYLLGAGTFADRLAHPLPHLVLLDLKMPLVDGHEVLRRTKPHDGVKRIPVVVLSSSTEQADVSRAYVSGANSYLVKPIAFDHLLATVRYIDQYWLSLNILPFD
jgi:two-component system response regulator